MLDTAGAASVSFNDAVALLPATEACSESPPLAPQPLSR